MILTAHQPAYLPWLGYFHKIAISDTFIILDDVQFEKNSFINRNKIKTPQGAIWLTVPVLTIGHTQKVILDIEINNTVDWRSKHWKSIYLNYKKAPYFYKYSDFFEDLYKKEWKKLTELLSYTLRFFVQELKINTKIYRQSDLGIHERNQQLILNLCQHFNAQIFVFGILGKNYADIDSFKKSGIKVIFQDYNHPIYPQLWGNFICNLSIADFLFNVGPENSLEIIMNQNITNNEIIEVLK